MKSAILRTFLLSSILTFCVAVASGAPPEAAKPKAKAGGNSGGKPAPLTFAETKYFHRWSKDHQHEFTPEGQEDLQRWKDMVTINYYPQAKDGDGLAATANSVLENYKSHKALVVKTSSVPRTPERPAEYLIVVMFPQPDFIEAVFAKFKLVGGTAGAAAIYSHREYGQKIGDTMSAWLQQKGPAIEKALMGAPELPPPATAVEL